ncbi:uncharacterized protein EAF02_009695 [Botrytis sinoallii]|uniref:uncharacterized protein n=1 Tax=Botrytis sinoallii TaxID=1463999 RepID=UPI0018FF30BE|nr:uncharacterized protein EAF02_009695 [Botrytis sinoallii]KAF7867504.1 hypothetical protein EAF02_009695 [Botrytis sinoallii]
MSFIIEGAIKGIAAGIGLASESVHAHKAKKADKSQSQSQSPRASSNEDFQLRSASCNALRISNENSTAVSSDILHEENDEHIWDLDAAQDELAPVETQQISPSDPTVQESDAETQTPQGKEKHTVFMKVFVSRFIARHPAPQYPPSHPITNRLPLPVILSQRRPKSRSRGFIRAYAPLLQNCDIPENMWLDFLRTFNKATQASPWIQCINFAGLAAHGVAPGVAIAVQIAIAVAIKAANEIHSRQRTNSFLDAMNNQFFRPRGLYALVLTWNPDDGNHTSMVDMTSTISKSIDPQTGESKTRNKFHTSSGNTYGDFEFPEAAPLVFPALDAALTNVGSEGEERLKEKLKRKGDFVSDYMDRRARAQYAAQNPNSFLSTGPKEKFTSRYADPNHPASSGNPWSLVTGGKFNPPMGKDLMAARMGGQGFGGRGGGLGGLGAVFGGERSYSGGRQAQSGGRIGLQREGSGEQQQQGSNPRGGNRLGGGLGGFGGFGGPDIVTKGVKKILGNNILYLVVVNMPSDEEIATASAQIRSWGV